MTNIYTIETIILLHKMDILKIFNNHYSVHIIPFSYQTLASFFNDVYSKTYGNVKTPNISKSAYINQKLGIKIKCLDMKGLPYISNDEAETKARTMYTHKKSPKEIVYIEHFIANNNNYQLIIDTTSGLSSNFSNENFCLYNHAISIFTLIKNMLNQGQISNDDIVSIQEYLSQNNHTNTVKLSEYYSHDQDYQALFRQLNQR